MGNFYASVPHYTLVPYSAEPCRDIWGGRGGEEPLLNGRGIKGDKHSWKSKLMQHWN